MEATEDAEAKTQKYYKRVIRTVTVDSEGNETGDDTDDSGTTTGGGGTTTGGGGTTTGGGGDDHEATL